MKAPIHSRKHYVQISLATVAAGLIVNTVLANGVAVSAKNAPNEVEEGAIVKAIFVEMWVRSSEASPGTVLVSLYKSQENKAMTFVNQIALDTYDNKRNILYHTQGLTNDTDADAIPFVRQWFKIPRGKQRIALADRLSLAISSQGAIDNVICGFATYKEYL